MHIVKFAYEKGFRVTRDGTALGIRGCPIRMREDPYRYFFIMVKMSSSPRKERSLRVHRLQAYQKFGDEMLKPGIEVRHLDGNPHNNTWDNIALGSHRDNMMDVAPEARLKRAILASSYNRRFTDEEVCGILKDRQSGLTYRELTAKWGANKSTWSFLFNRALYAHSSNDEA